MKLNKEDAVKVAQFTQVELETLGEVLAERLRQHAKWGEQNHPNVLVNQGAPFTVAHIFRELRIPTAVEARSACQAAARNGTVTWADIALEEFSEAIETAAFANHYGIKSGQRLKQLEDLRGELIQTAAVLIAWAGAVDRQVASDLRATVIAFSGETMDVPAKDEK